MPGTLTKADIIAAIQTENGYFLQKSADTVETLIEIIKRTLETGEDVLISGYGKFCVKDKNMGISFFSWSNSGGINFFLGVVSFFGENPIYRDGVTTISWSPGCNNLSKK